MSNQGGQMFKVGDMVLVKATVVKLDPDDDLDVQVEIGLGGGGGVIWGRSDELESPTANHSPSIAEIAVRIAAGLMANPAGPIQYRPDTGWGWANCDAGHAMALAVETSEALHAELVRRGHITP